MTGWNEVTSRKQSALATLLEQMEVPKMRKDTTRKANIRWLLRNLAVNNKDHPMFETTMELIKWLLKKAQ
jgi:hypothetical protein